jgi:hypothetical protein
MSDATFWGSHASSAVYNQLKWLSTCFFSLTEISHNCIPSTSSFLHTIRFFPSLFNKCEWISIRLPKQAFALQNMQQVAEIYIFNRYLKCTQKQYQAKLLCKSSFKKEIVSHFSSKTEDHTHTALTDYIRTPSYYSPRLIWRQFCMVKV